MVIFSIIVLTVGFILIFLPSIFLCKGNEGFSAFNDALQHGVASNLFLNSLLINAAICLPYALDVLLDSWWNRGYNKSDHAQNSLVRLMPILIFGIPDTLMFVYKISPRFISQTLISQSIACLCYMTLSLRCDDLGVWNKRVTKHMIALITSIGVLAYYAETACVHSSPYYILMFLLYSITATFGLFYFTYHCYLWYRKYPGWNEQTPEQLFCLLYMVQLPLYISAQFLVWAIGSQLSPLTHFTAR